MSARRNSLTPDELRERIDRHKRLELQAERQHDFAKADAHKATATRLGRVLAEVSTLELFTENLGRTGCRQHPTAQSGTIDLNGEANGVTAPEEMMTRPTVHTADEESEDVLAKLARFPWAKGLRKLCLTFLLNHGAHTADEVAQKLNKNPFAIRPRFSELETIGAIRWTGEKRNVCGAGKSQKVWEAL